MFKPLFNALISGIWATPFEIPSKAQLATGISLACQIYVPESEIGSHIRAIFTSGQSLPPLVSYDTQISGLQSALRSDSFGSLEEFNAFLANVLWESICLTAKTESCGSSCSSAPFQGRGYIQLTGQSNYQAFADYLGRQDIMTNPDQVATDETLAWSSALFFWYRTCQGITSVGDGNRCVNSPECDASSSKSPVYFQFAPVYRLKLGGALGFGSDTSANSRTACNQMNINLLQTWVDFCNYHGSDKSINCRRIGAVDTVVGSAPVGSGLGPAVISGGGNVTATTNGTTSTTTMFTPTSIPINSQLTISVNWIYAVIFVI